MGAGDKWENDANDANGVVLYGADGSVIRRVGVDSDGNLKFVPAVPGGTSGLNKTYEDTSFVTGDSPAVHDFFDDVGRVAKKGWIVCDGSGNIEVEYSKDGTTYGGKVTLKAYRKLELNDLDIKKVRVTWVTDSKYQLYLV